MPKNALKKIMEKNFLIFTKNLWPY